MIALESLEFANPTGTAMSAHNASRNGNIFSWFGADVNGERWGTAIDTKNAIQMTISDGKNLTLLETRIPRHPRTKTTKLRINITR
jgi:hypothetical protein